MGGDDWHNVTRSAFNTFLGPSRRAYCVAIEMSGHPRQVVKEITMNTEANGSKEPHGSAESTRVINDKPGLPYLDEGASL